MKAFGKIIPYMNHLLSFINAKIFNFRSATANSELDIYIYLGILTRQGNYATLNSVV